MQLIRASRRWAYRAIPLAGLGLMLAFASPDALARDDAPHGQDLLQSLDEISDHEPGASAFLLAELKPMFQKQGTPEATAPGGVPWECVYVKDGRYTRMVERARCVRALSGSAYGLLASSKERARLLTCSEIDAALWNVLFNRFGRIKTSPTYYSDCTGMIEDFQTETGVRPAFGDCLAITSGGIVDQSSCLAAVAGSADAERLLRAGVDSCITVGDADLLSMANAQLAGINWENLSRQKARCPELIAAAIQAGYVTQEAVEEARAKLIREGRDEPSADDLEVAYLMWFGDRMGCEAVIDRECRVGPARNGAVDSVETAMRDASNWVFKENKIEERMEGEPLAVYLSVQSVEKQKCSRDEDGTGFRCTVTVDHGCRYWGGGYEEMQSVMSAMGCPRILPEIAVQTLLIERNDGGYALVMPGKGSN